jgi:hypothetical protein
LDFERTRVQKQDQQEGLKVAEVEKRPAKNLQMGDQIGYDNTVYRVISLLKQSRFRMENLGNGAQFTLSKSDGLYASLVEAKATQVSRPIPDVTATMEKQFDQEPEISAAYGLKR